MLVEKIIYFLAASRPLAIALTTSDGPLTTSPATNTFGASSGSSGFRNPMASSTMSA